MNRFLGMDLLVAVAVAIASVDEQQHREQGRSRVRELGGSHRDSRAHSDAAFTFLIDGMLRQKVSDQYQTAVPPQDPAMHLLSSVSCNSTLCRRYSELISSCAGHGGGSP
ncbi:hypothetical protein MTO96_037121 [Rhipicephalus appendiculatus]